MNSIESLEIAQTLNKNNIFWTVVIHYCQPANWSQNHIRNESSISVWNWMRFSQFLLPPTINITTILIIYGFPNALWWWLKLEIWSRSQHWVPVGQVIFGWPTILLNVRRAVNRVCKFEPWWGNLKIKISSPPLPMITTLQTPKVKI